MRVLHVITGLNYGGAENQLALTLRHTRHEAEVIGLYDPGFVFEQLKQAGIPVRNLGMKSNRQVTALLPLVSAIRNGSYQVVHAHLFRAQVYARLAARLARIPIVLSTEHSLTRHTIEGRPRSRAVKFLYRAAERLGDRTIAVSPLAAQHMMDWGISRDRIVIIPLGIDLEQFAYDPTARADVRQRLGLTPDDLVIGTVSRLVPTKRIELLIDAAEKAMADGARLVIVGDGPQESYLRSLVRSRGLDSKVVFAGKQRDVAAMLSAMDLFVTVSGEETYGLATLEALAAGLPAVVANCPALDGTRVADVFWTTANRNDIEGAIREALQMRNRDRGVPAEGLEQFDVRRTTEMLDDLYEVMEKSRL